jgi:hypothetical protein
VGVVTGDLFAFLTQYGAPGVLAVWLYREIKERERLQRKLEEFLPVFRSATRTMRNMNRVMAGDGPDEGHDGGDDAG